MAFRLSFRARDDVVGIAEAGQLLFGAAQARRYNNELFDIFELIARNPRIARERLELMPPFRVYPFKAHVILYAIEANDDVVIVRVRHGREDWSSR